MTYCIAWWYATASVTAFALYGIDKRAAVARQHRIPERTLLLVGLLGGWPGAFVAQRCFRHKTRKRVFQLAFWLGAIGNVLLVLSAIRWLDMR
jgi:uncharacterized membrane protein YsdA (DUF1294 family)